MRRLLVLWDVDYTLLDAGGTGRELYQLAFREMFGRDMPQPGSMAGRTDRAIAVEVLTLAGVPEPRRRVDAFHALMAARAPGLAHVARERVRALPGAEQAVAALADGYPGARPEPAARGREPAAGGREPAARGREPAARGREPGTGGREQTVQSLLTGNIRPLAEVKLGALALAGRLDLDVGAYGDAHEVRAELVPVARRNAELAYGGDFGGQATVLVGDTPFDVGAALATGARAVGVATGSFSAAELAASGAHAVLPDLADTDRVLAAILGPQGR